MCRLGSERAFAAEAKLRLLVCAAGDVGGAKEGLREGRLEDAGDNVCMLFPVGTCDTASSEDSADCRGAPPGGIPGYAQHSSKVKQDNLLEAAAKTSMWPSE
mmetsp:Transcript_91949/g.231197  ORF Transcript_91949/g.231197 Transcript_91949/m.231197 type:complete len:102 (+) Transcript_91949:695-1000(+)